MDRLHRDDVNPGYMRMREEADRAEWWRQFRSDLFHVALMAGVIALLAVWAVSPMPPVLP